MRHRSENPIESRKRNHVGHVIFYLGTTAVGGTLVFYHETQNTDERFFDPNLIIGAAVAAISINRVTHHHRQFKALRKAEKNNIEPKD